MWLVASSLLPGLLVATLYFGHTILLNCAVAVGVCLLADIFSTRNPRIVSDGSATVTGLLIGLSLPPSIPLHLVALAGLAAILLGKVVFGGLGKNTFNPAMVGYALVLVAFPEDLTHFDATTGATALDVLSHRGGITVGEASRSPAFGDFGALGYEYVNVAFLGTGLFLVGFRIIPWYLPLGMLVGLALPALLFYDSGSSASLGSPLFHLFAGGTMLAAFYVVTDPVTAPRSVGAKILFATGIGCFTLIIRAFGAWPDGIAFAVLLGNAFVPLLDKIPFRRRLPTS